MTGFTINIARSEVIDLDITIDQAIQFMVSCGVVCPIQVDKNLVETINCPKEESACW